MNIADIRKAIEEGRTIIGFNETLKEVNSSNLKEVLVATNLDQERKTDLERACKVSSVKIINFEGDKNALGVACKKPFSISVLGLK